MDLGIAGRRALVTGATAGIGRAIAQRLAEEGVAVAIASRDPDRVRAVAERLGAVGVVHDVGDVAAAGDVVRDVESRIGPVDILVCNTGGPPATAPTDFDPEQWLDAYRGLVLGPMALVDAVVPAMAGRGWGRVVNVSGTSVREPLPTLMLSNAHRISTLAAFKTLARDVAASGVTLNTVLPGVIETERVNRVFGSPAAATDLFRPPAGRLGTVREMAAAVAFLCSDLAGYVNGEHLAVDGALTQSI